MSSPFCSRSLEEQALAARAAFIAVASQLADARDVALEGQRERTLDVDGRPVAKRVASDRTA